MSYEKANEVVSMITDAAHRVYMRLGGSLERTVYETALAYELERKGLQVQRKYKIFVEEGGGRYDKSFKVDLMVEGLVIVQVHVIETIASDHQKQVISYVKLAHKHIGLLINFGEESFRDGIIRLTKDTVLQS